MDKFIGKRLDGRYEISQLIGVGGMAVVYKAYDNLDDRIVVIKILKEEFLANDEFRRRFKNESKAIAVLSHPNIVKVFDVSFGDVLQYIVMEYIDGITLKDYISRQGVIDYKEAIHFAAQVLKAIGHAHEKGIVHRDIKPQNIILLQDGTVKVADFGIARFSRSEQKTITDKAIGSVHYISPEQARGDFTDGKADIYSVGVLLYELLTGKVPFQAESAVSVAIMQLQNEPVHPTVLNSSIPKGLEQITLKAMQKDPNNRYKTAYEMLIEIEQVLNDETVVFNHQYFVDTAPTKVIGVKEDLTEETAVYDDFEKEEKKSPVIPVLVGVASVCAIALIGFIVFFILRLGDTGDVINCPDFVGMKYEDITSSEEFEKFNDNFDVKYEKNSEVEIGVVFKQTPKAGTKIKEEADITLFVSVGAEQFLLDDYSSKTYELAFEEMEALGFVVDKMEIADPDVPKGYVIKTIPPAKSTVRAGEKILVYVSTGEDIPDVTVSDYIGMSLADAKSAIESDGLRYSNIQYVYDDNMAEGYVVKQSPEKGKVVELDSSVSLYISKGKQATTIPTSTVDAQSSITATIPLPDADATVRLTVFVNGIEQENKAANLNLNDISNYTLTLTGKGKSNKVVIEISDVKYREYDFNFENKTFNLVDKNDEEVLAKITGN